MPFTLLYNILFSHWCHAIVCHQYHHYLPSSCGVIISFRLQALTWNMCGLQSGANEMCKWSYYHIDIHFNYFKCLSVDIERGWQSTYIVHTMNSDGNLNSKTEHWVGCGATIFINRSIYSTKWGFHWNGWIICI